ncbi:amidase [Streptomyces sp. NPDC088801]|uniref:amidase n=1 Tax=Streptomyces sp. NPDC088801 TaxID=3365903 RepID=UPI003802D20B
MAVCAREHVHHAIVGRLGAASRCQGHDRHGGLPTTVGCRAIARHAVAAGADAACLTAFRRAEKAGRLRFVGLTNLNELAFGIDGINPWFGTPVNPLDPARVPGGSSSGSAVAVAAGEAELALGTDTGGSVRLPAACCGVCGLKTTWGRVPSGNVRLLAPSLDTIGPLAGDVAGLLTSMTLLEPGFMGSTTKPTTIGRFRLPADPAVDAALDSALASAELVAADVELHGWHAATDATGVLLAAEAWREHVILLRSDPAGIGVEVAERLRTGGGYTQAQMAAARAVRIAWQAELDSVFADVPLIALPTLVGDPPPLDKAATMYRLRATMPVNLAGVPAVSIPVPRRGQLPAGLQLIGPANSEELLLATASRIESAIRRA